MAGASAAEDASDVLAVSGLVLLVSDLDSVLYKNLCPCYFCPGALHFYYFNR